MTGNPMDRQPCAARSKSTGEPCKMLAIPGGKTCRFHGSGTRRARDAAARRVAQAEVERAVATFGEPRPIDPAQALLEEIHRTAGAVAWLEQKIRALNDEDLVWGMTRIKEGGDDRGTTFEAGTNAWLVEYRAERKHLVDVCKVALAAGVAERQVQLAEQQGVLMFTVVRAILSDPRLGLTEAQQAMVPVVVPEHMRAIEGGSG